MFLVPFRGLYRRNYFLNSQNVILKRYSNSSSSAKEKSSPSAYSREHVRQNVQGYLFTRYIDYLKNYDKVLETRFPKAMHVYRIFMVGMKDFYSDTKQFLKILRIANNSTQGVLALTRKEMELYDQMPKDMLKVAPVLLLSALPFANYVIFPLAYMYPRLFLTSHFWSIQQRFDFQQIYLKKRLDYNRKVFRCLQAEMKVLNKEDKNYEKWRIILGQLGSGMHPTTQQLLDVREIFTKPPYSIDTLSTKHLAYLCGMHGIRKGIFKTFRRYRLVDRQQILSNMDLAIRREGGVHNMPVESLKLACYIRGLNARNMSNDKMIEWLQSWCEVSLNIDSDNQSLYLHLPIFIGYNHPNNWQLIYKR